MSIRSRNLSAPIALILAPRTDTIIPVLEAIKRACPIILYVIADAGWTPETELKFVEIKKLIAQIDWCEVRTNYAHNNMGAKMRLASGISWVFEHEERVIILEHDCLPHPSFFQYCDELLEYYKDDERVMHIGGDNFFKAMKADFVTTSSYFFATIPHIWGWATWRRAWKFYDVNITKWPEARKQRILYDIFRDDAVAFRWENRFQEYYEGRINSWDGQWTFAVLSQGGLCINPCVNLVSNIGFGTEALSCKDSDSPLANIPSGPIKFPLKHPLFMVIDQKAEICTHRNVFYINKTQIQNIKWYIKTRFPKLYSTAKFIIKRS